jgi:hypothetical protein
MDEIEYPPSHQFCEALAYLPAEGTFEDIRVYMGVKSFSEAMKRTTKVLNEKFGSTMEKSKRWPIFFEETCGKGRYKQRPIIQKALLKLQKQRESH